VAWGSPSVALKAALGSLAYTPAGTALIRNIVAGSGRGANRGAVRRALQRAAQYATESGVVGGPLGYQFAPDKP